MGTNYYVKRDPCPHCGRSDDRLHIGKSSFGWTFTFQGTETIRSEDDWRRELAKPDVIIQDEYDRPVTQEEFWLMVDSKRDSLWNHARDVYDPNSSYTKYEQQSHSTYRTPVLHDPPREWLDDKGNSFSLGDFS